MFVVKRDNVIEGGEYFTKPWMAKAAMHRYHREDGLARTVETWPDANARPVYSVAAEPNRIQAKREGVIEGPGPRGWFGKEKRPLAKPRSGLTIVKGENHDGK